MVKLQQPVSSDADHHRPPSKPPPYEFSVPFELGSWHRRRRTSPHRRPPSPPPNRDKIILRIPCRRSDPKPTQPSSSSSDDASTAPSSSPPAPEDRPILERRKGTTTAPDVDVAAAAAAAPKRTTSPAVIPPRLLRPREGEAKNKKKRPDLYISLSKTEIEEDFIAMTGRRPPRYPERRPKAVQRMINARFPGSMLPRNITADSYTTDTPSQAR